MRHFTVSNSGLFKRFMCFVYYMNLCVLSHIYVSHANAFARCILKAIQVYPSVSLFSFAPTFFFRSFLISFLFESLENCGVDTEFPNYILLNLNDVFVCCCCFSEIRSICAVNIGSNETEVCMHVHMHLYFLLFQYRHECVCLKSIQFSHE